MPESWSCTATRSYYVCLWPAADGVLLTGGKQRITSSRFQSRADATSYLEACLRLEPFGADGEVFDSCRYPELLYHCPGAPLQAVGSICPKCRQMITLQDARDARAID